MKISYNWLRAYIRTGLSPHEVGEVLTAIGLETEGVEKIESVPGGLKGVVVGEVLECAQHPDADRLRLTKVNVGGEEALQIVCGAPNVAAGQKVLVATIGTKLFPVEGEPLTIKKGKIRGQESHGMICAEDELGIGKSHDGIMILNADAVVGTPAAEYLNLEEDHILEIGLTPNRTDAISHYGVARDLYAALRNMVGVKKDAPVLSKPSVDNFDENRISEIGIEVRNNEACPRYSGLSIKGVKIAPSPKWLQDRLNAIGLRPINNVVDITNFVQHEIGQPLHAFDERAIDGKMIIVRTANNEEKFVTLDGVERTLSTHDLVIADSKNALCIAGVFGGLNSGVSESTTEVFLESAYFNPVFVRKTAKRHGLHTDASFRFERGCDPNATIYALKRAALLIVEIAGGEVSSPITDIYPDKLENFNVDYNWKRTNALIGKDLGADKVKSILRDLEIQVKAEDAEGLRLSVPLFRADVQREADVVEEVLRIYGYDNIEFPKGLKTSLSFAPKPDPEAVQNKVADLLSGNGFSEMIGMSLTRVKYLELNSDDESKNTAVHILNPLSSDLGMMRQTLLYGGLEAIALNQNHRTSDLRTYEFGKAYFKTDSAYKEEKHLAVFLTGKKSPEAWNSGHDAVSFSDLKGILEKVLKACGIQNVNYASVESAQFDDALTCTLGKTSLATLGSVASSLLKEFDIKQSVWYADIHWENVLKSLPKGQVKYSEPEKFPGVRRDLSLLLDKAVKYSDIERIAFESEKKLLRGVNLFDVYEGKNLAEGKKSYAVSFALQDKEKTMTDQQVDAAMSRIQKMLEEKLGASLRI